MTEIKKSIVAGLTVVMMILLTACWDQYDENSYKPKFTINGFSSVRDIGAGSLVAYWAFEGGLVDSVSKATGENKGITFGAGFKGQSLQGVLGKYAIADLPAGVKSMTSFTIDFWMNAPRNTNNTADGSSGGILTPLTFTQTDQFWGSLDFFFENTSSSVPETNGNLKVHFQNSQVSKEAWFTSSILTNCWGTWQNIALTYDATTSTFSMYQSGNLVAKQVVDGLGDLSFPTTANQIVFGTEQFNCSPSLGTAGGSQGWAGYLNGYLDEVRIYNKALTATELQALIVLQGKGK